MRPLAAPLLACIMLATPAAGGETRAADAESELAYGRFAEEHDPSHPLYCMYGYFASKTGDHGTARRIFERCATEARSGAALVWLSMFYDEGLGVPRDPTRAEALLREAATGGYSVAQYHLGAALLARAATAAEVDEARDWLGRAAAQGDADARRLLDGPGG
jgi:TPR repeat protein